jgi:hypothetical protein
VVLRFEWHLFRSAVLLVDDNDSALCRRLICSTGETRVQKVSNSIPGLIT